MECKANDGGREEKIENLSLYFMYRKVPGINIQLADILDYFAAGEELLHSWINLIFLISIMQFFFHVISSKNVGGKIIFRYRKCETARKKREPKGRSRYSFNERAYSIFIIQTVWNRLQMRDDSPLYKNLSFSLFFSFSFFKSYVCDVFTEWVNVWMIFEKFLQVFIILMLVIEFSA